MRPSLNSALCRHAREERRGSRPVNYRANCWEGCKAQTLPHRDCLTSPWLVSPSPLSRSPALQRLPPQSCTADHQHHAPIDLINAPVLHLFIDPKKGLQRFLFYVPAPLAPLFGVWFKGLSTDTIRFIGVLCSRLR